MIVKIAIRSPGTKYDLEMLKINMFSDFADVIPTVLRALENNEVQRNRGLMGTKYCDKPR